jgi:hypothetical protein
MQNKLFRHIVSTCGYVVTLFFVLWANNLLINWALNKLILPFFGWFYSVSLLLKLVIVFGFGTITLVILFGLFMWLTTIIGIALSNIFLYNKPTYIISILMCLTNIVISIFDMWPYLSWDFWKIIIWLLLAYFIFQMNWVFVFKDRLEIEMEMDALEQSRKY